MDVAVPMSSGFVFQQSHDFAKLGVAIGPGFLVDRNAIAQDLESTSSRRDQLYLRIRKSLPNFGRQTGGPGLIVSNDAVFDRDLHSFPRLPACVIAQGERTAE